MILEMLLTLLINSVSLMLASKIFEGFYIASLSSRTIVYKGMLVSTQVRTFFEDLNDEYMKAVLRDIKKSLSKKYKSGKLEVKGKYTFILPDFYGACEYWFMGIDNPKGLLDDGEVYCSLFRKSKELDCLRSPHLYKEHAIRTNVAYYDDDISDSYRKRLDKLDKWFTTKAVYTSTHDMISKVLQ